MKKSILFAMFFGGVFAANAQTNTTAGPASANVTLNVNLSPLQSIVVNSKVVDLNYVDSENYQQGVSATQAGHLTVFSTGDFKVSVMSNATELTSTNGGTSPIDRGDIKIKATSVTGGTGTALTFTAAQTAVGLTGAPVEIGTGTAGTGNIDVVYTAAGGSTYLKKVNGNTLTTYSADVTYSILPK